VLRTPEKCRPANRNDGVAEFVFVKTPNWL